MVILYYPYAAWLWVWTSWQYDPVPLSRTNDKRKNYSMFSIFWEINSWLDDIRAYPSIAVSCMQEFHAITCSFSKYFKILYIFAQIFKYFSLFLKNYVYDFAFYNRLWIYTDWIWKKVVLGGKKSYITILKFKIRLQNSVQTPIAINQVSM